MSCRGCPFHNPSSSQLFITHGPQQLWWGAGVSVGGLGRQVVSHWSCVLDKSIFSFVQFKKTNVQVAFSNSDP